MAEFDNPNLIKSYKAGAAIKAGLICKLSAGKVIPCSVLGEAFVGVATMDANAVDDLVSICIWGECDVQVADDTIGVNGVLTRLRTDANGRAVPWLTGSEQLGFALEEGYAVVSSTGARRRVAVRVYDLGELT